MGGLQKLYHDFCVETAKCDKVLRKIIEMPDILPTDTDGKYATFRHPCINEEYDLPFIKRTHLINRIEAIRDRFVAETAKRRGELIEEINQITKTNKINKVSKWYYSPLHLNKGIMFESIHELEELKRKLTDIEFIDGFGILEKEAKPRTDRPQLGYGRRLIERFIRE